MRLTDAEMVALCSLLTRQIARILEQPILPAEVDPRGLYTSERAELEQMWRTVCEIDQSADWADMACRLIVAWLAGCRPEDLVYGDGGECLCTVLEDGSIDEVFDLTVSDSLPVRMSPEGVDVDGFRRPIDPPGNSW